MSAAIIVSFWHSLYIAADFILTFSVNFKPAKLYISNNKANYIAFGAPIEKLAATVRNSEVIFVLHAAKVVT